MTGPEQISSITNRALKSTLPFLPGTLSICIRHFAVHLSHKQSFYREAQNGVQKEMPHSHHPLFSSSQSWMDLSLAAFPCSLLSLRVTCTTPAQGQSMRRKWCSKSTLPVKLINKSCINHKEKLFFCLKPWTEEELNSHPLFLSHLKEPECPHFNGVKRKDCKNQMSGYFCMQSRIRPWCLTAPIQS